MKIEKSTIKSLLDSISTRRLAIWQQAGQCPMEYNIVEYVREVNVADIGRVVLFTGTIAQCLEHAVSMVNALNSVPHCLEAKRVMMGLLNECDTLAMQDVVLGSLMGTNGVLRELDDMIAEKQDKWACMRVRVWDTGIGAYRPQAVHYADIQTLIWELDSLGAWKLDITGCHGDNGIGAGDAGGTI